MKAANLKVRRKISCLDKGKAWEFKLEKARESKRIDDRKKGWKKGESATKTMWSESERLNDEWMWVRPSYSRSTRLSTSRWWCIPRDKKALQDSYSHFHQSSWIIQYSVLNVDPRGWVRLIRKVTLAIPKGWLRQLRCWARRRHRILFFRIV